MNSKKAFTLIEVILAILIFGIGILTILNMIINNIRIVDRIRNKTTSTFLAKEWLEIIYNLKDTNLKKWLNRDCEKIIRASSRVQWCDRFSSWDVFKVNMDQLRSYDIQPTNPGYTGNMLYLHSWAIIDPTTRRTILTWTWYDHNSADWEESIFYRYVSFSWAYLSWDWWYVGQDQIMKIQSAVLFKKWPYTWEVILESMIWKR